MPVQATTMAAVKIMLMASSTRFIQRLLKIMRPELAVIVNFQATVVCVFTACMANGPGLESKTSRP